MKKLIIFLLTIVCISIAYTNVYASTIFYEGEYIPGIYTRSEYSGGSKYQQARFFKLTANEDAAYCIEPFATFNAPASYYITSYAGLPQRVLEIAYFGYNYKTHTTPKWYAITQMMIWRTLYPNNNFYFTNGLNGNVIEPYNAEINEINSLIQNYKIDPNLEGEKYNLVGNEITLTDTNNVISEYVTTSNDIIINGNKVIIKNLKEGVNEFTFTKRFKNNYATYYASNDSQNLLVGGHINDKVYNLKVYGTKNSLTIEKIDSDTQTNKSSGDAKLEGAIFGMYDANDNLINEITINKEGIGYIENIQYGNYYLKELKAGEGYNLNDNIINFKVDKDTSDLKFIIENEAIKKEIVIHKEFGEENNTINEANISFDIYDTNNNLIDTITTDELGNARITLPYGKYLVSQRNTNNGYNKIDDFSIVIDENNNDYTYNLYDYKIKVPNTGIKESNVGLLFFILVFPLILLIKKCLLN